MGIRLVTDTELKLFFLKFAPTKYPGRPGASGSAGRHHLQTLEHQVRCPLPTTVQHLHQPLATTATKQQGHWLAAGLVQAVLGAASAVFAGLIGRRLAGPMAGLIAAGIYALYPNLIFHTGVLLGETLYNFLFLGFLAALLSRPWTVAFSTRRVLACGVLLGLAVLVRP